MDSLGSLWLSLSPPFSGIVYNMQSKTLWFDKIKVLLQTKHFLVDVGFVQILFCWGGIKACLTLLCAETLWAVLKGQFEFKGQTLIVILCLYTSLIICSHCSSRRGQDLPCIIMCGYVLSYFACVKTVKISCSSSHKYRLPMTWSQCLVNLLFHTMTCWNVSNLLKCPLI